MDTALSKRSAFLQKLTDNHLRVFGLCWAVTFIIYLPAAKAGMVGDFPGWLYTLRNYTFADYVNRPDSTSLYQFTQLVTYGLYKIFGINPWAWHLLHVTLHAVNCLLLFIIGKRLFRDSGIGNGGILSLAGILLYCFTPYNTEVIVHEPCYHYLQAFLILLLIMYWVQQFHYRQSAKYAVWAALLYLPSTYSLELFYITPWVVLTMGLYYRYVLHYDRAILPKVFKWFFLPLIVMYIAHVIVLRLVIHTYIAHTGVVFTTHMWLNYLAKPAKYLFHILVIGRYMPLELKTMAYAFCESGKGIVLFYALVTLFIGLFIKNYRSASAKAKLAFLFFIWAFFSMALIIPQDFSGMQYVLFDRYTYFMMPFIFWMIVIFLSTLRSTAMALIIFTLYSLASVLCTVQTNIYWKRSAYIARRLINDLPDTTNKTIILLNPPENMNGVLMVGSRPVSITKLAHNLYTNKQVNNDVYEVASYNMASPTDGAHVIVVNDSVIKVTLNQWGTWWWYHYLGAHSYENEAYRLDMKDLGHWYELTLKRPADQYLLLFSAADQWKPVDWNKKNIDQY